MGGQCACVHIYSNYTTLQRATKARSTIGIRIASLRWTAGYSAQPTWWLGTFSLWTFLTQLFVMILRLSKFTICKPTKLGSDRQQKTLNSSIPGPATRYPISHHFVRNSKKLTPIRSVKYSKTWSSFQTLKIWIPSLLAPITVLQALSLALSAGPEVPTTHPPRT